MVLHIEGLCSFFFLEVQIIVSTEKYHLITSPDLKLANSKYIRVYCQQIVFI